MRKICCFIVLLLLTSSSFLLAQSSNARFTKGKIGISYASFGSNDLIRFVSLEGAASYNSDYFHAIGLNYIYSVNNWLEAETGLEYAWHGIVIHPNLPPQMDATPRKRSFELLQIPLSLRFNFWKYFYINSGLFLGVDASIKSPIHNQTGIGALAGLAIKHDFNNGLSVFVNPYTKMHALIPFQPEKYHQRLLENGVRLGINYRLRKKK